MTHDHSDVATGVYVAVPACSLESTDHAQVELRSGQGQPEVPPFHIRTQK
jgi:hypothetical protein